MPHYTAFVRKDALEAVGMDAKRIYSLYDLSNSDLDTSAYSVFHKSLELGLRARTESSEEYQRLVKDPDYIKLDISSVN